MLLLSNYFEDIEGLATLDLLRRAKIDVDTVSIDKDDTVITQSNVRLVPDKHLSEINLEDYDFVVIPGGKAVNLTHRHSESTAKVIRHFYEKKGLIAAICAAPSLLGPMGILDNKKFTCFPTFETYVPNGKYDALAKVVVEGNIITSKAAGTSFEFAYEIIKYLKGEKAAKELLAQVHYQ
jgi:4-methyl-5(b-hydroxyethyl)-thiazole monophosphate biosynthesis